MSALRLLAPCSHSIFFIFVPPEIRRDIIDAVACIPLVLVKLLVCEAKITSLVLAKLLVCEAKITY
jgi:hypothetical protein